ncbi:hypothetical protein TSUD_358730 [Trifolium subterraneum]|uniref:Protein kinase domain-containing protein n=1 Tax=Trifolium subterraneum TaxID=3900 RepID=A0A2Z6MKA8_TRISU|nr:hypothetical protein TSUD_358730 [Trifolium subterraneum]
MTCSMSEAEALLSLKNSFSNSEALDNWIANTFPCTEDDQWAGVVCVNGLVTGLRLRGMGLFGKIDVDALVELKGLRTINLMNNSFTGSIPELNRIGFLKAMYLSGNKFSGNIPREYFQRMKSLKKVWLSNNEFTGVIPSSLAEIPQLVELHLENNQFSGNIPNFNNPSLMKIDVSNNNLEGEVPEGLLRFNQSSFQGNSGLCGTKIGTICGKPMEQTNPIGAHNMNNMTELKNNNNNVFVNVADKRGMGELMMMNDEKGVFGLPDLMKASAEVLGNGGLGSSYKAVMSNGFSVVVKRTRELNGLGKDGFEAEMKRLGRVKHYNVLTPLAYHYRKDEKLVITEYVPRGTPEALKNNKVSPRCDVYCLGVVILEILTGKFPSQYLNTGKGGTDIVQWVASAISEGREVELLDPEISSNKKSLNEMQQLLHIGAACTESNPQKRLDMFEAIRRIEGIKTKSVHFEEQVQESRTIEVLPSLTDGLADSSQAYDNQGHFSDESRRRHGNKDNIEFGVA